MAEKIVDRKQTTKEERRIAAEKFVKEAISNDQHFIVCLSTDNGEDCKSNIVGYGKTSVFAHCLVQVIQSDEKLKHMVMADLAAICVEELAKDLAAEPSEEVH